jgi:SAM-dependent methyltransferase
VTSFDLTQRVREQYATEANLRARQAIYANAEGPDARDVAFEAIAALQPVRVLEVGGGQGELAERMAKDLGAEVTLVDLSPRMVELARGRGVDARVGDVQELPFSDGAFDVAVAAWMLYHVPDLDRGLSELVRVLAPGGHLVAVTNGGDHLKELRELFPRTFELPFWRENGEEILRRHFARVERRDVDGWVTLPDRETVESYVASLSSVDRSRPEPHYETPLRVRTAVSVFVAAK